MNGTGLTNVARAKLSRHVRRLILRLLDHQVLKGICADITEHEIMDLCMLVPDILTADSPLVQLTTEDPIMIVGDIYGQYGHLVRLFNHYGHPPEQKYLFLGNYINQGSRSVETIALLFAYKVRYPKDIFLLRGKHECARLAKYYGFYDECVKRFSRRLWNAVVQVFPYLPCAAIVDDRVFCVHSGISPMFNRLDVKGIKGLKKFVKRSITLPGEFGSNRLLTHFVWSDPDESVPSWDQNPTGMGYLYGPKAIEDFCNRFGIIQIIRSSEMIPEGYEFFQTPKLLSVFSAPDYLEKYANDGSLVFLFRLTRDSDTRGQLQVLSPVVRMRNKQTARMNMTMSTIQMDLGCGLAMDEEQQDASGPVVVIPFRSTTRQSEE